MNDHDRAILDEWAQKRGHASYSALANRQRIGRQKLEAEQELRAALKKYIKTYSDGPGVVASFFALRGLSYDRKAHSTLWAETAKCLDKLMEYE